jgi:hypothetical protein
MVKWFLVSLIALCGIVHAQEFKVESSDVGTVVDLTGQWHFKPASADKEVTVPVPQMLSRIQWWLDDSEDFKKWEQARLDKLGFDTEKTDDGTYRATIDLPPGAWPKDKHLWIEFDGVAMRSKTFINGQPVGEHAGMFSRFAYDLTPHLKPGKNELTVWVGMEKIPQTSGNLGEAVTVNLSAAKVISMSKGMFGPLTPNKDNRAYDLYGIWQPVKLVVRGDARIDDVWFQPTLTGASMSAELSVQGPHRVRVRSRLTDLTTGKILSEHSEPSVHSFSKSATVTHGYHQLSPKLWTPADPNLYRLDVFLESPDGKLLDHRADRVGFRTFEVKGNQFLLNGKSYWLRGANQLPYGKNPWDPELPRKLISLMHDGNQRFTRTHATPWNESWLDAADEIGLAVSIEGIRPWAFAGKASPDGKPATTTSPATREIMPPPEIFQHWLMENEDVVRRCRNHPSVFMFTVGNEMLLRDAKNMKKWELLSQVTKQTRKLSPDRPIVVSSDYVRDAEFYETTLKAAGIDDGDVDDMHRYNGWYADSPFVVDSKFDKEVKGNAGRRPLIGQEMSSGYPDLDTGLPVLRYTRDLLTPQAWVGNLSYPGNDPAPFLAHHAAVTKRWAEQLRFQRCAGGDQGFRTAGFSLFSAECWYRHSYLPEATPYPVYDAVKQAFAPIGVAVETTRRRFYAGEKLSTHVFVTNDDERFRDFDEVKVQIELAGVKAEPDRGSLPYYATARMDQTLTVPPVEKRTRAQIVTRVTHGETEIARTVDDVELFPKPAAPAATAPNVIVLKKGEKLDGLAANQPLRQKIEAGATAIVFSPIALLHPSGTAREIVSYFPNDLLDAKDDVGEFVDWSPAAGTRLVEDLQPLDLKWWGRKNDWRAFVASSSHRLKPGGAARELFRYIPSHSYISADKLPEQYRCVLSEIPLGNGRLWICDLDFAASAEVDPVARIVQDNLFTAAADPESTRTLPKVPPHEQLLKGVK